MANFIRTFINDFNENIATHINDGGRTPVPAEWMREPITEDSWRQELPNFGFWPHNHASWYLVATAGKLTHTADKYIITSSSGHAQAWYDSIGLAKYQAGVRDLYQVATLTIYVNGDGHVVDCDQGCVCEASECYVRH